MQATVQTAHHVVIAIEDRRFRLVSLTRLLLTFGLEWNPVAVPPGKLFLMEPVPWQRTAGMCSNGGTLQAMVRSSICQTARHEVAGQALYYRTESESYASVSVALILGTQY